MKLVLVTGGLGYIGSHTTIELLKLGYEVIIIDNLSNSEITALDRIIKISGKNPIFEHGDVCDEDFLRDVFSKYPNIYAVIHFAAFKAVGESVSKPLMYYQNNLVSLISLLNVMNDYKVINFIFSSSCTVYGQPDILPVTEETPLKTANSPYGNTKQICESIILDYIASGAEIKTIILRYFNPVGADLSGEIGELPQGTPNNLMPYITQTALGIREKLMVFGDDYDTSDGSAVRDYIHVSDLANAHILAINYLENHALGFSDIFNIGTGEGYTVLQVVQSINKFLDSPLPIEITERRKGDVEKIWADSSKANLLLKWTPKFSLDDMTSSALKWEKNLRNKK